MNNQIDEIAKRICTYPQCIHYNIIGGCENTECPTVDIAEQLYKAGYRKQEDVAREIFEEIEFYAGIICCEYGFHEFFKIPCDELAELKKKYGVQEDGREEL